MSEGGVDNTVLAERIEGMARDVSDIKTEMKRIAEGMERIARLEERHSNANAAIERAFTKINNHDERLAALEVQQPITVMVRNWVITGVVGVVGLLGTQLFAVAWFVTQSAPK